MADNNQKTPEEASSLFHNIMKASVSKSNKQSYCFDLPNGVKVIVDPSNDERVIFTLNDGNKAESFAYSEESNTMFDYPVVGSFSLSNTNALAVNTYLQKKQNGTLQPCQ